MNPDNNSQNPNPGQVYGPQESPNSPSPQTPPANPNASPPHNYDTASSKKTKKIIVVLGIIVGVFVVVGVAVLLLTGGDKPKVPEQEQTVGAQNLYKEPSAIEIENLNNSISDDVTNLSTDADFPSDKLTDKNLSL